MGLISLTCSGTANVLSAADGSTGTISASSTFLYNGAAATINEAPLVSTRNIGALQVTGGALNIQ